MQSQETECNNMKFRKKWEERERERVQVFEMRMSTWGDKIEIMCECVFVVSRMKSAALTIY